MNKPRKPPFLYFLYVLYQLVRYFLNPSPFSCIWKIYNFFVNIPFPVIILISNIIIVVGSPVHLSLALPLKRILPTKVGTNMIDGWVFLTTEKHQTSLEIQHSNIDIPIQFHNYSSGFRLTEIPNLSEIRPRNLLYFNINFGIPIPNYIETFKIYYNKHSISSTQINFTTNRFSDISPKCCRIKLTDIWDHPFNHTFVDFYENYTIIFVGPKRHSTVNLPPPFPLIISVLELPLSSPRNLHIPPRHSVFVLKPSKYILSTQPVHKSKFNNMASQYLSLKKKTTTQPTKELGMDLLCLIRITIISFLSEYNNQNSWTDLFVKYVINHSYIIETHK